MKQDRLKGYLFALLGTIAFSNEYIFSKAALNEVHLAQFGTYWFLVSTICILLYTGITKSLGSVRLLSLRQIYILVVLGLLEIMTATTFYLSIHIIPDPAVTSFLGNMYPVWLVMGGVLILREKFGPIEIAGAMLALAGTFMIGYTGEHSIRKLFIPGTGIVLINTLFAATASLVVKVHVKKLSPELINLNRSVWLLFFSLIMVFLFDQSFRIPASALKNITIGAILGPFLAILAIYYSLRYIEISYSSIVQSLKGIFVLIGGYLVFGTLPQKHQITGGLITMAGIIIMALARSGIIRSFRIFKTKRRLKGRPGK
jgi:drug/metabolite transporter (DMT)-like permease